MQKNDINTSLEQIKILCDEKEHLTNLEKLLLNVCEFIIGENAQLKKEAQSLKDEINRLKGEQGVPQVRKQTNNNDKSNDHSSEKDRKKKGRKTSRHKRGSNKAKAKSHQTTVLSMKPEDLPVDAVRNGVKKTLVQDIRISAHNTLFIRQQYYSAADNKYYLTPLPPGYEGEYGPQIKSWANVMYSSSEMTLENITGVFNTAEVMVSKATVHSFIMGAGASMEDEKLAIAKAGLQSTSYQHLDDTSGREKGQNRYVNVIGNEFYSLYFTLPRKDRLSIIKMLSLDQFKCAINPLTFELMKIMKIPDDIIASLQVHNSLKYYTQTNIEDILDKIFNGKKQTKLRKLVLEATAIAAYRDNPYAIKQLIVDDAPQFKLIAEVLGLCWIHEGRHYKKLHPIFKHHKKMTESFITRFWDYYDQLLQYKEKPTQEWASRLREEFKTLFSTKTGYEKLDKQIATTLKKATSLLLVLEHPHLPLHNNPAELMARRQARARDIHLHTMSEKGTQVKDALATISETAKKLSVNVFEYFYDRITSTFKMTSLAELITTRAAELNTNQVRPPPAATLIRPS